MNEPIKKIALLTSGGDAPGMNAAIRSVVRACTYYRIECVGVYRGYEGLIEGDFETLSGRNVSNIINKGGVAIQFFIEFIKRIGTLPQSLRITTKTKIWINAFNYKI